MLQSRGGLGHEAPLPCRCSLVRHKLSAHQQLPVCGTRLSVALTSKVAVSSSTERPLCQATVLPSKNQQYIAWHASLVQHLHLQWSPRRRPRIHEWSFRQGSSRLHQALPARASQHLPPSLAHEPVQAMLVLAADHEFTTIGLLVQTQENIVLTGLLRLSRTTLSRNQTTYQQLVLTLHT